MKRLSLHRWLKNGLHRVLAALGDALFPVRCQACRGFYESQRLEPQAPGGPATEDVPDIDRGFAGPDDDGDNHGLDDGWTVQALFAQIMAACLCPSCRRSFQPAGPPCCTCCGDVYENRHAESCLCAACIRRPKHFSRARACGVYTGSLKALIHRFKYGGRRQLAEPLGSLLLLGYRRHGFEDRIDLLVPVPLHKRRLRRRGFNQSGLPLGLWPALARRHDRPLTARLAPGVIERRRATLPQASIGRRQRAANIKDAFRVVDPAQIRDQRILLIDDVYTTGATVNECARVLKRGGARQVSVLTLARALHN